MPGLSRRCDSTHAQPNPFRSQLQIIAEFVQRDGHVWRFACFAANFVHEPVAGFFAFTREHLQVFVVENDAFH